MGFKKSCNEEMSRMSQYSSISNFGKTSCKITPNSDPLTYCLVNTLDSKFQHGGQANALGPQSRKCQNFMAQRCANNWDGFCEYYYRHHGPGSDTWPNTKPWPNTSLNGVTSSLSIGEQLLQNAARLRFCDLGGCAVKQEKFDPIDPNSPYIPTNIAMGLDCTESKCFPRCVKIDPKTIDDDPVMIRMLENPKVCADTLVNICNNAGSSLRGTKIGQFCDIYRKNMNALSK